MSFSGRFDFAPGPFVQSYRRGATQRMERAALVASDRAARQALGNIRSAMKAAGLGRLPNAIGASSDLAEGRGVFRRGGDNFSASGVVFVRGKSARTLGAIAAYTEGASITPVRGQWLWIAQPDIPSRVGKYRMTPALYDKGGFAAKIGPLRFVRGISRNVAYLVVDQTTVDPFGRRGRAKALGKRGRPLGGRVEKKFLVAFVGIKRTARVARANARAILQDAQRALPDMWAAEMRQGG